MIVKMKKVTLVVQAKDIDDTLNALKSIGVLHIEHESVPSSDDITKLRHDIDTVSKALAVLSEAEDKKELDSDPGALAQEILGFLEEKDILEEDFKNIKKNIDLWKDWGDFPPTLIEDLKLKGIWVRLCKLNPAQLKKIPKGVILEKLFKRASFFYCAIISREELELPFDCFSVPEISLGEMRRRAKECALKIREIERKLAISSKYKDALGFYKRRIESMLQFNEVREGAGKFEKLFYLKGYCPVSRVNLIEKKAEKERWGLLIETPLPLDNVPTLIENPRWVRIIQPIFEIIKTIPGYREVDISLWFLVFFSVFFGMLVGDAGYGSVFLVINLFCHKKFGKIVKETSIFFLIYILSICAIGWGALTGTIFGQAFVPSSVKPLLPYLRNSANVQALCFLIGAIHLSVAHLWKALRKMPSLRAVSEAGWVCMIWTAYLLAKLFILGESFPVFGKYLLIGGVSLIVLFSNPTRNILKTIGSGIGNFLINVISSFTDVVSYIRLFAVGTATVAVADAFNQMAFGIGFGSLPAGFITALILLFGHTLNILLGAMAVVVHGVRLNVLEFSGHLNMEWSGVQYAPFKAEGE